MNEPNPVPSMRCCVASFRVPCVQFLPLHSDDDVSPTDSVPLGDLARDASNVACSRGPDERRQDGAHTLSPIALLLLRLGALLAGEYGLGAAHLFAAAVCVVVARGGAPKRSISVIERCAVGLRCRAAAVRLVDDRIQVDVAGGAHGRGGGREWDGGAVDGVGTEGLGSRGVGGSSMAIAEPEDEQVGRAGDWLVAFFSELLEVRQKLDWVGKFGESNAQRDRHLAG